MKKYEEPSQLPASRVFFFETFSNLVPPENCARKRTWSQTRPKIAKLQILMKCLELAIFQHLLVSKLFQLWLANTEIDCLLFATAGGENLSTKIEDCGGKKYQTRHLLTACRLEGLRVHQFRWCYNCCKVLQCFHMFHHVWDNLKNFPRLDLCNLYSMLRKANVLSLHTSQHKSAPCTQKIEMFIGCTLYWPHSIPKTTSAQHPWKTKVEPISSLCFVLFQELNDKSHDFSCFGAVTHGGESWMSMYQGAQRCHWCL